MSEGGRTRSSLSGNILSPTAFSQNSNTSPRNPGFAMDVSSRKYTTAWVKESRFTQKCRKVISNLQINGGNEALIESRNHELKAYESRVTENEEALITIGPCPIPTCTKHHEVTKDVEMAEHGQYNFGITVPSLKTESKITENSFKVVNRKNAAKPRPTENTPEIVTANKFQHLMEIEEQENTTDPQEISIPAINLKLTSDYNFTLQEISRNHPETTNKYDRGYIKITPNSYEDREKILDFLNKNEKEYVLSEAQEARPIKIVIKDLPPDHSKEIIADELTKLKFKVLRINQLRNFRLKTLLPIFLVELSKTPNVNDIYKVNKLNFFKIKIESYRKNNRATMCYNCSEFFHSARNCRCKPRCIKCNQAHETRNCQIKEKIENPTCINCNETGHLASWKGCPKYPKLNQNKPPTYAQKLKNNLPNKKPETFPKNPTDETNFQAKSADFSDFQRNFNAIQIINDAFKRFPNLIEISEKIKTAKNDSEIIFLLIQLIKN
ncbi:Nucleic-acid-binding protein from transposon X-element [Araneus ventricosus]|uniref:Nucleic-acid-binding protein from transposon X-element n=2 Tax=Araneus ventricosus TaxID=182803 RepID=A0A4Y2S6J3_ARAVE|nr:Nucleic-acid-binding protein from transposon X-element [Araneus ventricosus]